MTTPASTSCLAALLTVLGSRGVPGGFFIRLLKARRRTSPELGVVAFGRDDDSSVYKLFGCTFDGFGVVGCPACFLDPFVEVPKVDDLITSFWQIGRAV